MGNVCNPCVENTGNGSDLQNNSLIESRRDTILVIKDFYTQ